MLCLLPVPDATLCVIAVFYGHLTLSGALHRGADSDSISSNLSRSSESFQAAIWPLNSSISCFARSAFSRASLFSSNAALALSARSNASTLRWILKASLSAFCLFQLLPRHAFMRLWLHLPGSAFSQRLGCQTFHFDQFGEPCRSFSEGV